MTDSVIYACGVAMIIVLILFLSIVIGLTGYLAGFKIGQIEAYNGRYTYKLIENVDGSKYWEEVELYNIGKAKIGESK